MTVVELIEILKKCPQNSGVVCTYEGIFPGVVAVYTGRQKHVAENQIVTVIDVDWGMYANKMDDLNIVWDEDGLAAKSLERKRAN